ncbi:beta-L-arabinofuranosidase domain-containing protein [Pollutibacter soli]|uniref:beta-L-arabinofuranosidase domain-containing protein n=1 Tax=Pollutibacter soli TaxID=3034157 RepID=UPI003013DF17
MKSFLLFLFLSSVSVFTNGQEQLKISTPQQLRKNPYSELPLGAIKPSGWLKEMLVRQKNGATGKLDELYPLVMNKRNGWLGGDGDQWERGPYWLDGLLPLAYILDDKELIAKTKPWVEWSIQSQQPDGYFGPSKDYPQEAGIQRDNSRDWWPKMVMLKVLKQYYMATKDQRVIALMTKYFQYQLKELPKTPLDNWTFWARYRGADNLMVVYWLYNITHDSFLLELGEIIHQQTFDYTDAFLNTGLLSTTASIHGVNLAQGFKAPIIYYQSHPAQKYINAVKQGLKDLMKYNGTANGMYGADEALHGNNPTQGAELCSAVELMFSLESMLEITGDVGFADHTERIAFNALPTQTTEDYLTRQYFQQANQVMITRHIRNFDINHKGTDLCYGLLTGYPCCTSNMHQGWPKFTQNLWYNSADSGIAALLYAPNEMKALVAGNVQIAVKEQTAYPFEEKIRFILTIDQKKKVVHFPFHLRIPAWCKKADIKINGQLWKKVDGNQVVKIDRDWKNGDVVELELPMHIFRNNWYENSKSIERGPIVYALKIGEAYSKVKNESDPVDFGNEFYEIRPTTAWNYGLPLMKEDEVEKNFKVEKPTSFVANYPWNVMNAPVVIRTKGKKIPSWQLYNEMAGPIPFSVSYDLELNSATEDIVLVPYGCTRLRISQFPEVRK